jgi:hypothetical protein
MRSCLLLGVHYMLPGIRAVYFLAGAAGVLQRMLAVAESAEQAIWDTCCCWDCLVTVERNNRR